MTVIENVQLALASHHGRLHDMVSSLGACRRREAQELLAQVGIAQAADRACRELAYGEVKRVVAERGVTVLFTEHSMDVVFALADRIIVMARGALIAEGDAAAIRNNAQVQEVYLGTGKTYASPDAAPTLPSQTPVSSPAKAGDPVTPDGAAGYWIPAFAGMTPRSWEGRVGASAAVTDADNILEVDNLNAWYGAARVLFDLTLRVGRGEAVALMGRNGSEKSTTTKTVMALMAQRTGTVRFCGRDISRLRPYEIARLGVGFVPEDRRV